MKAGRYRFLLNLIDHLPAYSHYGQVLSQDERLAEQMDPDAKPGPPPLTAFGPDVQAMAAIHDRLGTLIALMRASIGDKNARVPKGYPRPQFAVDRVRRRKAREKHERIKAQLLPGR